MSISSRQKKIVILSLIIIVFSICFNILSNKVKVRSLKPNETFTVSIDKNLSPGEYQLEYYIACSSSDDASQAMNFNLKSVSADGVETVIRNYQYKRAIGYGTVNFQINNSEDTVTAEFTRIGIDGFLSNLSISAVVGNVYVSSKDGSYREAVHVPGGLGKQAVYKKLEEVSNPDIKISDFAMLKEYAITDKILELKFLCTKKIPDKYELGVKILSDNINTLLPDGMRYSFYSLTPATDTWVEGEEYTQSIDLGLASGRYNLDMVFSLISPKTPRYISNYQLMDNKDKVFIGSIDIPK